MHLQQEAPETSYLQSCANHELLAANKEKRLAKEIVEGSLTAKNDLIQSNRRLALKLAQSHRSDKIEFMDRLSAAMEGLIIAAGGFEPSKGRFSTYAYQRIRERLQHQLNTSSTVYVPARQAKVFYSRKPKEEAEEGVKEALKAATPLPEEALGSTAPWENALVAELSVDKALNNLDPKSQSIISMRYGLRGRGPYTQREVGRLLGYSSSRVSDIENEALESLKRFFSA